MLREVVLEVGVSVRAGRFSFCASGSRYGVIMCGWCFDRYGLRVHGYVGRWVIREG